VSLVHQGPYEDLKSVYPKVFEFLREKGYTAMLPTREIYLKGPGMILKGNPKRYLTEIHVIIGREES
jgi:effector-binding domain-containing protein